MPIDLAPSAKEVLPILRSGVGPVPPALCKESPKDRLGSEALSTLRILPHHLHAYKKGEMSQSDIARVNVHPMDSAERLLLISTDTLATILDLIEDAIVSVDHGRRIVVFNQAAERIFGYAAGEICGKSLDLLLPSHFVLNHGAEIVEFARSPQASRRIPERREILARRKNGEEFPAEASISRLQAEEGWIFTVILRESLHEKQAPLTDSPHRV